MLAPLIALTPNKTLTLTAGFDFLETIVLCGWLPVTLTAVTPFDFHLCKDHDWVALNFPS